MSRFAGKVAIVTGSSAGIGRHAAIDFAKEGASVTIHGQSPDRLKEVQKAILDEGVPESRVLVVRGPIEDEKVQKELVDKTVEKFGRIDVLVNNAGIMKPHDCDMGAALYDIRVFDYVFTVNVRSVILLTELAVPHLEKTKGCVVNISSIGAQIPTLGYTYYAMSKAALDHWGKDAAAKYAPQGIRVNTISPGPIRTEFLKRHGIVGDAYQQLEDNYMKLTLLGRFGVPQEVSRNILHLASADASFITGATLVIDGGVLSKPVA